MAITVQIDSREILEALGKLRQSVGNLRPVMKDIGKTLVSLIHQNLGQGITPQSEPMEHLKFRKGIPLI
ncbi:MAG: hypothetical protein NTX45_15585 [Proteobacteria bacterium]|nr:hypothetical protein [Pseudomonadota bacterium]